MESACVKLLILDFSAFQVMSFAAALLENYYLILQYQETLLIQTCKAMGSVSAEIDVFHTANTDLVPVILKLSSSDCNLNFSSLLFKSN